MDVLLVPPETGPADNPRSVQTRRFGIPLREIFSVSRTSSTPDRVATCVAAESRVDSEYREDVIAAIRRSRSRSLVGPPLLKGPRRLPLRENFTRQTPVCAPPLFALLSRATSFFLHARSHARSLARSGGLVRRTRRDDDATPRRLVPSASSWTGRILSRRPLRARARAHFTAGSPGLAQGFALPRVLTLSPSDACPR